MLEVIFCVFKKKKAGLARKLAVGKNSDIFMEGPIKKN